MKKIKSTVKEATDGLESARKMQVTLQSDWAGFRKLAGLLKDIAGIHLVESDKSITLMSGRLSQIIRRERLTDFSAYYQALVESPSASFRNEFISALTTNTTEFFRESRHFEILNDLIPKMIRNGEISPSKELRVWCAASSTGQEPYSILITLLECLPNSAFWDIRLLATDIDLEVLQRAASGIYSEAEIKGIPPVLLQKYFERVGNLYRVLPSVAARIRFAPLNLFQRPYPFQYPFDLVFCRNVLIYFERDEAIGIVQSLGKALRPKGYLFLGHAETSVSRLNELLPVSHAVYQRVVAIKIKKPRPENE